VAEQQRAKRALIAVAVIGILIQMTGIFLMATERLPVPSAVPFIVIGMFMAFAPIFGQLKFPKK
jgi:uncharacterized membrane protein